jgi:hypothetical protein
MSGSSPSACLCSSAFIRVFGFLGKCPLMLCDQAILCFLPSVSCVYVCTEKVQERKKLSYAYVMRVGASTVVCYDRCMGWVG